MDQDNIEISNNQSLEQDVNVVETESNDLVDQSHESSSTEEDSEASGTEQTTTESEPDKETYTKAEFEKALQERLARSERKLKRELRGSYPVNQGYAQPAPSFPANTSTQAYHQPVLNQQQIATMTPEQQADYYLSSIIDQKVNEKMQHQMIQKQQEERNNFFAQVQKEASKDEHFEDFVTYEIDNIARQLMPNQVNGLASLVDLSQKLNDPRILFEIHKQNQEDFRSLINMPRELQAAKLGEYRARAALNPRKVVSSARSPISDPPPKTSSHQTIDPTNLVVTDRVALERAKRGR